MDLLLDYEPLEGTYPEPKLSMFCLLSQNYQHFLGEKKNMTTLL